MKRKVFSILFASVLAISLVLVPAAVSANPGPVIGFWQPNIPAGGDVVYSTTQSHSATHSFYLEALKASSPADANEVYVGEPTGVTTLNDLNNVGFWYYCPAGGDPVAPHLDVWLDTDTSYSYGPPPTGDDEWLLGKLANVTTFDAWVQVQLSDIGWYRATGGTYYGTGSTGLATAQTALGTSKVLAIGIEVGSHATWATTRAGDQTFYVDDFTINATTYDFEPSSGVGLEAEVPEIIAISVTPTSIDFGTLYPGQTSPVTAITVENIGTVIVDVTASITETGSFFTNYLYLDTGTKATGYVITALAVGGSKADPPKAYVQVPSDYQAKGVVTGTLIFEATAD